MNIRIDFVSEKTGRVLLSSLFDTPPEGLTRRECQKAITALRQMKEKVEGIVGQGTVRMTLDDYPSSVFWYLVLFRPIIFDPDDPWFGKHRWSVFDILESPLFARKLKEMDLGVIYDPDRNWLTLVWDEARSGILDGIDNTPTWRNILKEQEKRLGHWPTDEWWKLCAQNHSFAVPGWKVARQGYLRGTLWHRPEADYSNVVVFDLAGVDVPHMSEHGEIELPVAKRANFVHFYTKDRREFSELQRRLQPRRWTKAQQSKAAARSKQQREKRKEERAAWIRASHAVADIIKAMGGGTPGRRSMFMSGERVIEEFNRLVHKFIRVELRITADDDVAWGLIEQKLGVIEKCLQDPSVPQEFSVWLKWKERGTHIVSEE